MSCLHELPTKRLLFAADLHLDCSEPWMFMEAIRDFDFDTLVIAGDVGNALTTTDYLRTIQEVLRKPVLFVLGNHDFYRGGPIDTLLKQYEWEFATWPVMHLNEHKLIELSPSTALVGIDGWADGRGGEGTKSTMRINDSLYIHDLCQAAKLGDEALFARMGQLADQSKIALRQVLTLALEHYETVYVVTHVPPLEKACRYLGLPNPQNSLPFFCNPTMGKELKRLARLYPQRQIKVLCGHTHDRFYYQSGNLEVWVAGATYRYPAAEKLFTIN